MDGAGGVAVDVDGLGGELQLVYLESPDSDKKK